MATVKKECFTHTKKTQLQYSVSRFICKVIVNVLTLVFLFLIRLRFSSKKFIAEIIRKRYGSDTVKRLRLFEKFDYKIRKNDGDLEFLIFFQENDLTPKIVNFKLENNNVCYLGSYKQCQSLLLKEEIKSKVSILVRQKKEFDKVKSAIQSKVSIFDFAHVSCFCFWLEMTPSLVKLAMYVIRNFITWD